MRHSTWAVWTMVAAGSAATADEMFHVKHSAVLAESVSPPPADGLDLSYTIYVGGLHIVDLNVAVDVASTSYEVQTQVQTVGFLHWATQWSLNAATEGNVLDALRLEPRRHRVTTEFRGRGRSMAIDYKSGEIADVRIIPPPRDDERRNEVPRAMMNGTTDPTSALLAVSRRIAAARGCAGRLAIFDGRRRYDIVVAEQGPEELPAIDQGMFSGKALRCDFTVEPLAGYDLRRPDSEEAKRRPRGGRAWFAELLPGRPAVPVRIEIDGEIASAFVHLTAVHNRDQAGEPTN